MRRRVVVVALTVVFALGIGWYVTAQNGPNGALPMFQEGDVLFAADLNAIVQQVEANTAQLNEEEAVGLACRATLSRAQEVPDPGDDGTLTGGMIDVQFDDGLTQAMVDLMLEGDASTTVAAHFHCGLPGETGPIAFGMVNPGPCNPDDLAAGGLACTLVNADVREADCLSTIGRSVDNIAALFFAAREGLIYANIHTIENGPGEIRGQLICED